MPPSPNSAHIIDLFNQCFFNEYRTKLVGDGEEPEYLPAGDECHYHRIVFTRDYVASALHEIAHWCVAGRERRLIRDYGYWYAPDGRSVQQQSEFELVEVKPQALEWIFSKACGLRFRVSADNLESDLGASDEFKQAVAAQAQDYCKSGINKRAQQWLDTLSSCYRQPYSLQEQYLFEELL